MKKFSRTEYSLLNMVTGIVGYGVNTVVGFVCRILFVRILSAEYLGISGLFTNILSMLSLAELGISSAITFALYKPIAQEDENKIASIMQFYRKAYIVIGIIVAILFRVGAEGSRALTSIANNTGRQSRKEDVKSLLDIDSSNESFWNIIYALSIILTITFALMAMLQK